MVKGFVEGEKGWGLGGEVRGGVGGVGGGVIDLWGRKVQRGDHVG